MIWVILLLAFILRLVNINQSLWLDEAAQILMSQRSLYSIIFERSNDFHPPLSYLMSHLWLMLGSSEIWLRLLPVIFGVGTVFIIYKLCQKLFDEKIALISALLLSTAPYHVYYSQEIRMYSIAAFFASLSMYFFITNKRMGYVLSTAALLYTHYMGAFLLVAQFIYKRNWNFLGLVLLTYLPWLPFLMTQLQNGVKADQYLPGWSDLLSIDPIKAIPLTFIKFSVGRINIEDIYLYGVVALVIFGFYGLLLLKSLNDKVTKIVWYWLGIPLISAWLISFILPMNQPFRLLFTIPAFYILLAVGINKLGKYWKLGLLGVLLISITGLFIYWTNPKFHREDWRAATNEIPANVIFAWPVPFDPYIWYGGKGKGVVRHFPANKDEVSKSMGLLGNLSEVYFFEYLQTLSDPNKEIQTWLTENGYVLIKTLNYNGVGLIYKYTK